MTARLNVCLALAGLLLAGTDALAQGEAVTEVTGDQPQIRSMRINVDVEDADLADVMEQIGRQVGRNILVDPSVQERVSTSLHDIEWREAVEVIARMTRCEVEERPGGILILTQPPKVTIQFTDANVRTVLQLLAAYSGKNIIISPEVEGAVTLDLKEVHWLRALYAIVNTVGDFAVVADEEDLLRVVPIERIEQQLETVVFTLNYVRPPALYRAVPPAQLGGQNRQTAAVFVGQARAAVEGDPNNFTLLLALQEVIAQSGIARATLQYDFITNSFIVTATKPLLQQIEAIINKVDRRPDQLYTEVRFVSTRDNNNQEYGIEFSDGSSDTGLVLSGPFPNGRQGNFGFVDPQGAPITNSNVGEYPFLFGEGLDAFTKPFALPAILDLQGLDMALNLIDRDIRSRIIQSPSLFMVDNSDAVIFVGENVPYATLLSQPDANGNVTQTLQEGQQSPVAVGFSLYVQPHLVPDTDRVNLTVIPRINELTGNTSPALPGFDRFAFGGLAIDLPRTREQALVTQVLLEDSYTAVLGGLRTDSQNEVVKKVPFLSSIPILGNLFTNKQLSSQRENLTIFITPTIVRQRSSVHSIFMRATRRLEDEDPFYRRREAPSEDETLDALDQEYEQLPAEEAPMEEEPAEDE